MQILLLLAASLFCGGAAAANGCLNLPVLYNGYPLVFGQPLVRVDSQASSATIRLAYCAMSPQSAWWNTPANVTIMAGGNRQILGRYYAASLPFNNLTNYQCFQTSLTLQNPRPNLAPAGDGGLFRFSVFDKYCGQFSTSVFFTSTAHKPAASTSGQVIPSTIVLGGSAQLKMTFCLPTGHMGFVNRVAWNLPNGRRIEAPASSTNTLGRMQAYRYQDSPDGCVCPGLAYNPATCWAAVLNIAYVSRSDAGRYSFSAINYAGQLYKPFTMSVSTTSPPTPFTIMPPMTTTKRVTTTKKPTTTRGPPTTTTKGTMPPTTSTSTIKTTTTPGKPPTTTTTLPATTTTKMPTTTTTTTTTTTAPPPCYATVMSDVVVLLDVSTQVPSAPVDGFQKALQLVSGVLRQPKFGYGPQNVQFAVATYSTLVSEWFKFGDYTNAGLAATAVSGIGHFGQTSQADVPNAFNYTDQHFTAGNGFRSGSKHKIVLFLAGKNTNPDYQGLGQLLGDLKHNFKYSFYGIGWSTGADKPFLGGIAGNPTRVMMVPDNTYSNATLAQFQTFFNNIICDIV